MTPQTESYEQQASRWPRSGRHVLAHFDDATIVVYQAYRGTIAQHALAHGAFGGADFSLSRMSWLKPNFLWMMHRSEWGTAQGQECVLAVRLAREFFDALLAAAVWSSHDPQRHGSRGAWQGHLATSEVRLQWDPDHDPAGARLERRAIQLGLRGDTLRRYATTEVKEIVDMTPLVREQRARVAEGSPWRSLQTPTERVYTPRDAAATANVGLD